MYQRWKVDATKVDSTFFYLSAAALAAWLDSNECLGRQSRSHRSLSDHGMSRSNRQRRFRPSFCEAAPVASRHGKLSFLGQVTEKMLDDNFGIFCVWLKLQGASSSSSSSSIIKFRVDNARASAIGLGIWWAQGDETRKMSPSHTVSTTLRIDQVFWVRHSKLLYPCCVMLYLRCELSCCTQDHEEWRKITNPNPSRIFWLKFFPGDRDPQETAAEHPRCAYFHQRRFPSGMPLLRCPGQTLRIRTFRASFGAGALRGNMLQCSCV